MLFLNFISLQALCADHHDVKTHTFTWQFSFSSFGILLTLFNYCVLCGLSMGMAWKIHQELRADEEWQRTCANLDISEFEKTSLTDPISRSLYRLCESEGISVGFDIPAPSLIKSHSRVRFVRAAIQALWNWTGLGG